MSFCDCGGDGASTQARRESAYDMLRVDDAVQIVLQQSQPLDAETIDAGDALHRVLAAPALSTVLSNTCRKLQELPTC
jgi:hypothetical protein